MGKGPAALSKKPALISAFQVSSDGLLLQKGRTVVL